MKADHVRVVCEIIVTCFMESQLALAHNSVTSL